MVLENKTSIKSRITFGETKMEKSKLSLKMQDFLYHSFFISEDIISKLKDNFFFQSDPITLDSITFTVVLQSPVGYFTIFFHI